MFSKEMMDALESDGEKLRQMTGEDHGPVFLYDAHPDCPECAGTGLRDSGGVHPWGEPIFVPCDCSNVVYEDDAWSDWMERQDANLNS